MADMSDIMAHFDEQIKNFGAKPAAAQGPSFDDQVRANAQRLKYSTSAAPEVAAAVAPEAAAAESGVLNAAKGFGAKAAPLGTSLLKGAGGIAGIAGGVLSAEDMAKNGVGVGNTLGLTSSIAGTAAMLSPAAIPAATLTAAPAIGYAIGQNLPDAFTTRLASLAGRAGFGARYVGGSEAPGATPMPSMLGPEGQKLLDAGRVQRSPGMASVLGTPPVAPAAAPAAPAGPATIDHATGQVVENLSDRNLGVPPPGGDTAPGTIYAQPGNGIENNQTIRRTVDANGQPVYTNIGGRQQPPGGISETGGYGAVPHQAARLNPATGLPYSSTITPVLPRNPSANDIMSYMADATRYIPAAGKEKQLLTQKISDRAVQVQTLKEAGADRRLAMQELGKPVTLTDASGKQVAFHPLSNKYYGFDKDGKPTVGDVTAGVPPYSESNARAMVAKIKAGNPKAGALEIRNRLKQYWPDADISSATLQ